MDIDGVEKPEMKRGYLGKQPKFDQYRLQTVSHNNPDIFLDDNEVSITIKTSQETKVTANLVNAVTSSSHKECVFCQTDENDQITFSISIPQPGFYKFSIFALPASEDSKTLFGVYNYLLSCPRASKPVRRYAKQYATFKPGCYLHEPLFIGDNNLSDVNFKVRVPGALDVALTVEGQWVHLTQSSPALWEGSIGLKEYKGRGVKLAVNANFGGEKTKYSTLLDYIL